jgi:alpha-beta hydrolase superfamily lysophospholipase
MVNLLTQARVTERVNVTVVFPADSQGNLRRPVAPSFYPIVLFIHGGLVPFDQYRWLARHFATRGYVVVGAAHVLDLAVFQPDNSLAALRAVRAASTVAGHTLEGAVGATSPVIVMGHSLGGVIATWEWTNQPMQGVVLLASYPATDAVATPALQSPVLSISGSQDGQAHVEDVTRGWQRFASPKLLAIVDGMNHYNWTDANPTVPSDRPATRPLDQVRRDALRVIDSWLDATAKQDADAAQRLTAAMFAGVMVTR